MPPPLLLPCLYPLFCGYQLQKTNPPSHINPFGGIMGKNSGVCSRNSINDGDFDEEEVWSYEKEDSSSPTSRKPREPSSSSSSAWRLPSAPRTIRRGSNSSSSASHETEVTGQSSAPLNIPDWSKIYGKHANMEPSRNESWVNKGDDDDDGMVYEDGDMVPPHEWLARELARTRISSSSVCEGVGRTLKGRDLSKVRNAVLTKTGFLE